MELEIKLFTVRTTALLSNKSLQLTSSKKLSILADSNPFPLILSSNHTNQIFFPLFLECSCINTSDRHIAKYNIHFQVLILRCVESKTSPSQSPLWFQPLNMERKSQSSILTSLDQISYNLKAWNTTYLLMIPKFLFWVGTFPLNSSLI